MADRIVLDISPELIPKAECSCGWGIGPSVSMPAIAYACTQHSKETGHEIDPNAIKDM